MEISWVSFGLMLIHISNPKAFYNEYAIVVGNLFHNGDPEIQSLVENELNSKQICYSELQEPTEKEKELLKKTKFHIMLKIIQ